MISQKDKERQLRQQLQAQLGTEFCSEEELKVESKKVHIYSEPPQISVGEIIFRCNEAGKKMSAKNSNRHLLYLCASALNQLVNRLATYEKVN